MFTAPTRLSGQSSIGPSWVVVQSNSRIRAAISPVPRIRLGKLFIMPCLSEQRNDSPIRPNPSLKCVHDEKLRSQVLRCRSRKYSSLWVIFVARHDRVRCINPAAGVSHIPPTLDGGSIYVKTQIQWQVRFRSRCRSSAAAGQAVQVQAPLFLWKVRNRAAAGWCTKRHPFSEKRPGRSVGKGHRLLRSRVPRGGSSCRRRRSRIQCAGTSLKMLCPIFCTG